MSVRSSMLVGAMLLLSAELVGAGTPAWIDPSKHIQRFVETEPNVRLEVLDWGGDGPSVVLLAGHGDTAHVFDDFAPLLTNRFHVFGITRRGFGFSTQPPHGYDLATLVRDIAHVLDALNIQRADLLGHSIAGDEMTRFALSYPDRVRNLVYLDAAYDRVEAQKLEAKFPSIAPLPAESGSVEDVRARIARTEILMPEAEIRATRVFGLDDQFQSPVTPDWIASAVARMVEHPHYASVHAPVLSIYTVYENPAQLVPRYTFADDNTRRALDQVFSSWRAFAESQRVSFRKSRPDARIVEIKGASHYCFISNRDEVAREVSSFLTMKSDEHLR